VATLFRLFSENIRVTKSFIGRGIPPQVTSA